MGRKNRTKNGKNGQSIPEPQFDPERPSLRTFSISITIETPFTITDDVHDKILALLSEQCPDGVLVTYNGTLRVSYERTDSEGLLAQLRRMLGSAGR